MVARMAKFGPRTGYCVHRHRMRTGTHDVRTLKASRLLLCCIAVIGAFQSPSAEKRLATYQHRSPLTRKSSARDLESRLTPYLSARARGVLAHRSTRPVRPSQEDLLLVTRKWHELSATFKALYAQAAELPSGMERYASPGGHFEVLFVRTGLDRVDTTDTYGYGPGDWRQRGGANGIPDYVDEIAWACDSAWSMEIDGFGFVEPHVYSPAQYPSALYKVAALNLDSVLSRGDTVQVGYGLYGQTWPIEPADGIGWVSRFELRNNWNGSDWRNVAGNDYEANPELAVWVTCVHEFLHGIQYSMSHSVVGGTGLDDFPIAWTEGTAVLMEDLGFDQVNDYIQYCSPYFASPEAPVLVASGAYNSSIVAMYLYQFSPGTPGIGFIHDVMFNNYGTPLAFQPNLDNTARDLGSRWRELLGGFHAGSYFTGTRSKTGLFLEDAPLLPRWSYTADGVDANTATDQAYVQAFGMHRFSRRRYSWEDDTLTVQFSGIRSSSVDDEWGVNVLLRRNGERDFDSLVTMSVDANGMDTLRIEPWGDYEELLLIASNAHGTDGGTARVYYDTLVDKPVVVAVKKLTLFPNPLHISAGDPLRIVGTNLMRVSAYGIDGNRVFSADPPKDTTEIVWDVSAKGVSPGTYVIVVERRDGQYDEPLTPEKRKVFLLP